MSNTINLSEPLVDTLIPTWTGLQLERASSQFGTFGLVVQIPYVAHQTGYSYDDMAGASTDWYRVARYAPLAVLGPYSTSWLVNPPTAARRSLSNYRRVLADKLGGFSLVTTDAAAPDNLSIIASDLAGGLDPDTYRQAWLYPTQTGRVDPTTSAFRLRRAGNQALNVTTGQLAVTVAFPSAIPSGVDVEIHTLLPPTRHDKLPGLRGCLNSALAELWTLMRVSILGVAGQPAYDLSTTNDWLEPGAIDQVLGPALDPTLNPAAWPAWETIQNGNSLSVGVAPTFGAGASALVTAFRPADTWIKSGGVWGPSSTGLQNDTDEALFAPESLVLVALQHAYHALATQGEASERAYYATLEQQQRARVGRWKLTSMPRPSHAQANDLHGVTTGFDPKDFGSW